MQADPIALFKQWLKDAEALETDDPNAMALATGDAKGAVSVRFVLLKDIQDGYFIFYTNLNSFKAQQIADNPRAAVCFYWKSLKKQVRIDGTVKQIPDKMADAYFKTRDRESQLVAWASRQSEVLEDPQALERQLALYREKFDGQDVPRPPFWSGYAVWSERIEFWTEKPFRLHDRRVYIRLNSDEWKIESLYP